MSMKMKDSKKGKTMKAKSTLDKGPLKQAKKRVSQAFMDDIESGSDDDDDTESSISKVSLEQNKTKGALLIEEVRTSYIGHGANTLHLGEKAFNESTDKGNDVCNTPFSMNDLIPSV